MEIDATGKQVNRVFITTPSNVYSPGSTTIDFKITNFPAVISDVKFRLTAPNGFQFLPQTAFAWKKTSALAAEVYSNLATMDWPGTTAMGGALPNLPAPHVMEFTSQATYVFSALGTQVYGFRVAIQVPEYGPTMSLNGFVVEFGYDGTTKEKRPYGGVVPFQGVSSLVNAFIDYSTNVAGKENLLTVQVEIMTMIPSGGGLYLMGPNG